MKVFCISASTPDDYDVGLVPLRAELKMDIVTDILPADELAITRELFKESLARIWPVDTADILLSAYIKEKQ